MESGLTLSGDMMLVLAVLAATIALFVFEVVRVDIVAVCIMVLLGLLGLVPGPELFNGFASNAVISIIAVMILGAGLDSTALRFPEAWPGVRFFEVDHPATQALKRDLMERLGATRSDSTTFVPVDFERDDLGGCLLAAGFDPARPAFVSWLNVTVFLSQDAVSRTLAAVGALSAPASELLIDFCGEEFLKLGDDGIDRMARTAEALGEPMGAGLSPAWVNETLSALGYGAIRILRPEDLEDLRMAAEQNGYRFMPACYIATAGKT